MYIPRQAFDYFENSRDCFGMWRFAHTPKQIFDYQRIRGFAWVCGVLYFPHHTNDLFSLNIGWRACSPAPSPLALPTLLRAAVPNPGNPSSAAGVVASRARVTSEERPRVVARADWPGLQRQPRRLRHLRRLHAVGRAPEARRVAQRDEGQLRRRRVQRWLRCRKGRHPSVGIGPSPTAPLLPL